VDKNNAKISQRIFSSLPSRSLPIPTTSKARSQKNYNIGNSSVTGVTDYGDAGTKE
jgi:hypothetical protein